MSTEKKGENWELKKDLNSEYRDKRKETVKKVIANMTVGKDVSGLFADVVKNMQTEDLELKKLVYLYLINYAKSQPELVILADSDDHNPLIRALAIRTMGCLRVEKIVDYLLEPLKKALVDKDPYVRKTAAICVAKLFDLNPAIAIDNGLITSLQEMLSDKNPMVIANVVAALCEISEAAVQNDIFVINDLILQKLMAALNECTEWGQISIMHAFSSYKPKTEKEASDMVERVIPRLQHANQSVVLAAVKVLMVFLAYNYSDTVNNLILKKLPPPLITLLSSEPEIQFVALRNINLILQKRPELLMNETAVFFTKYNDPLYVKLEKLDIIVKLAAESNIDQVISELKEYANEVDVEFVRNSVKALGTCAIKIPAASDKCVAALLDLIKVGVVYVVQEAMVVAKDIFRRYKHKYEGILPVLCAQLEVLDEPDAKAALIWIIGEYAERIENAATLLEHYFQDFKMEKEKVQLHLITAIVKLFLRRPQSCQELVQKALKEATLSENPDIRDRSFIYWRLLSSDIQACKNVVLAEKPPVETNLGNLSVELVDELIMNIASLASVYHKSAASLGGLSYVDIDSYKDDEEINIANKIALKQAAHVLGGPVIENLLDFDIEVSNSPSQPVEILGGPIPIPFLQSSQCNGLGLSGAFIKAPLGLFLVFTNESQKEMSDFAIQFNFNTFGISPNDTLNIGTLGVQKTVTTTIALGTHGSIQKMDPPSLMQIAIKNDVGIYYFSSYLPDRFVE